MTNTIGSPASVQKPKRLSLASRTALFAGLAACTVGLTSACSLPDWADMSSKPKPAATSAAATEATEATEATAAADTKPQPSSSPSSSEQPAASPSAAPTKAPVPRGDLRAGSLTRVLDAGASKLVITYWTKQNPGTWTAADTVPVQFAAHLENAGPTQTVYVSRFAATLDDGSAVKTVSEDKGGFVITPPYSYSGAMTVHPSSATATSADLTIQFDLLVETSPGSGQFFRQTVLDTVHLEFAH